MTVQENTHNGFTSDYRIKVNITGLSSRPYAALYFINSLDDGVDD